LVQVKGRELSKSKSQTHVLPQLLITRDFQKSFHSLTRKGQLRTVNVNFEKIYNSKLKKNYSKHGRPQGIARNLEEIIIFIGVFAPPPPPKNFALPWKKKSADAPDLKTFLPFYRTLFLN